MSVSYAQLEGLRTCMNHYAIFDDTMKQKMTDAIKRLALSIVGKAQQNLKDNGSNANGNLSQSGAVRPQMDGTVDAGFSEGYAYFVEYGRRAGGFPPLDKITEWVWKKKSVLDADIQTREDAESLAYVIARKIAARGYDAKPFLMPAVASEKKASNKFWREAYRAAVAEIDRRRNSGK